MKLIELNYAPGCGNGRFFINPEAVSTITEVGGFTAITTFCGTQYYVPITIIAATKLMVGEIDSFAAAKKFDADAESAAKKA
jgi:hypothetical protein